MAKSTTPYPALATTVFVFVLGLVVLLAAAGGLMVRSLVAQQGQAVLAEAVEARGRGLQATFMQSLFHIWSQVEGVAGDLSDPRATVDLATRLDDLTAGDSWVAWAGYAGLDGTVQEASDGLQEGESVASQPWFSQGLRSPFAGDAHEAVLLSERLGTPSTRPLRFLDLAAPVTDIARRPIGVVGAHIDLAAATERFRQMAEALGIKASLIGTGGQVVIASADLSPGQDGTASLRAARVGGGRPFIETWPDGKRYMTIVLDDLGYRELPDFGWALVVRMPMERLVSVEDHFLRWLAIAAAAGLAIAMLLTALYVFLYIRPFSRLAESAGRIAAGEDVYPYESRRTREVAILAAALAILQSRSHSS